MNRVAVRLAWRELWRRPGRTVLAALLVAVPVTGLALIDLRYRTGLDSADDWVAQQFGTADGLVSTFQHDPDCPMNCLSPEETEVKLPAGSDVAWVTSAFIPLRNNDPHVGDGHAQLVTVVAQDMADPLLSGTLTLAAGDWPAAPDEVAASRNTMSALGVRLGDPLRLRYQSRTFRVVGELAGESSMLAPGFDFDVLRPGVANRTAFVDLPDGIPLKTFYGDLVIDLADERLAGGDARAIGQELVLGWLGGVLAMSLLGVVVAAAFAVSGRRQLVTIGQLSASGADPQVLSRTLALQGTITGTLGAGVGLLAAWLVHVRWPWIAVDPHEASRATVAYGDMVVIALTAVGVATVAALAPTRALAHVSVLTALAGRRPVGPLPVSQSRRGGLLLAGGLTMAVVATASGSHGGRTEAGVLAAAGMLLAVVGLCMVSPALVHLIARWSMRGGVSRRIAARDVARHRSRAAAVFTSLLMVGMAASGIAAFVEYERAEADGTQHTDGVARRTDIMWARAWSTRVDSNGDWMTEPVAVPDPQGVQEVVDLLVEGQVTWTSAAVALSAEDRDPERPGVQPLELLVVDDGLLQLLGVPDAARRMVMTSDTGVWLSAYREYGNVPVPGLVVPTLPMSLGPVISRSRAVTEGMLVVENSHWFGIADHPLTWAEATAVGHAGDSLASVEDALFYMGAGGSWIETTVEPTRYPGSPDGAVSASVARAIVIGMALAMVVLVVAIGMALWAAEGRDGRDILVAVGASPHTLARVAAWRAGGLTAAAMVLAVPGGVGIAWLISNAAGGHISPPRFVGVALLVPVPLVIGLCAWALSLVGQRLAPTVASRLAVD